MDSIIGMKFVRSLLLELERQLARPQKTIIIVLMDAFLAPAAFFLTTLLVYGSLGPLGQVRRLAVLFPCLFVLGALASVLAGLPRIRLKTYASFAANGILSYAFVVGAGTLLLTQLPGLSYPVTGTIIFSILLFLAAIISRVMLLKLFLWVLAADGPQTRVLIYGAGKTGQQLASALQSHESIGVVAFIDDEPSVQSQRLMGKRIYPSAQIEKLVREFGVTRVLLAMPSASAPRQAQISRRLQSLGLRVQALPSFAQLVGTEQLVESLTTVPSGALLGRNHLDEILATGSATYRDKIILISGAGGSVGSELCRQLIVHRPAKLVLYEVSELALYNIERDLRELIDVGGDDSPGPEIVPVLGSVTDTRLTRAVLAQHGVDTVFHAAAYKHVPLVEQNPVAGIANNVFGTRILADACTELNIRRFILVSTDKAVRPTNIMGASKRLAELVIQDRAKRSHGTHFSIVRFGNVLGSSGSVIPLFREQIARGGPITLTHGDVTRYFMTIAEASKLVLMAGSFLDETQGVGPRPADVFVLDMGKPVRIRQLAEQMIVGAGCTVRDADNPDGDIEIRVIGLRPGEKLHEELLIGHGLLTTPHPKILRAAEESLSELEMANAMRELGGFVATGDADGLRMMTMQLVRPRQEQLPAGPQTAALAT